MQSNIIHGQVQKNWFKILNKEIILASQLLHFIAEISSTMIKKKILTANWFPFEGSFLSVEQPMRTQESLCSVVISQERLLKIEDFILNQNDPASRTLLKGNLKATQEVLKMFGPHDNF